MKECFNPSPTECRTPPPRRSWDELCIRLGLTTKGFNKQYEHKVTNHTGRCHIVKGRWIDRSCNSQYKICMKPNTVHCTCTCTSFTKCLKLTEKKKIQISCGHIFVDFRCDAYKDNDKGYKIVKLQSRHDRTYI